MVNVPVLSTHRTVAEPSISMAAGVLVKTCFMNFFQQVKILPPAAEMNDGKQNKEAPVVPEQPAKHHRRKDDGSKGSCFKCLQVKSHERVIIYKLKADSYTNGLETSAVSPAYHFS